jgi:SpoIID/LytB domain protein
MALTASEVEGTVTFKGRGTGHGVGLSLCGARLLAEKGATGKAILATYFPDCEVRVR